MYGSMKILKFGAVWCPGCLIMRPIWQQIEKENPWLVTKYFDFDTDKREVEKYKIDSILPVFVFIGKDGNELLRLSGEVSKEKILEIMTQNREK